jgi:hypothetical protein
MTDTVIYNSKVKARVKTLIECLPEDGTMKVSISKVEKNRSLAQNRLLWKWMGVMGNALGYTKQEMHDVLCCEILGFYHIKGLRGEVRHILNTTKNLSVDEFAQFLSHAERIASEQGIVLPHPEDEYYRALGLCA